MFFTSSARESSAAPAFVTEPPVLWKPVLALLAALLLQSSLGGVLNLRGAAPPLVTLVVVWYALRAGAGGGTLFGTIAGACEDALAGWTGAAWTIATGLLGAICGRIAGTPAAESSPRLALLAVLAVVVRYALFAIVVRLEALPAAALGLGHFKIVVWQALLAGVLAYLALRVMPRLGVSRVFIR